jgi:hypothetical protein
MRVRPQPGRNGTVNGHRFLPSGSHRISPTAAEGEGYELLTAAPAAASVPALAPLTLAADELRKRGLCPAKCLFIVVLTSVRSASSETAVSTGEVGPRGGGRPAYDLACRARPGELTGQDR